MCVLTDSFGCPKGCNVSEVLVPRVPSFHGGPSCNGGSAICTVDYWREGATKSTFSDDEGNVLRRTTAVPLLCAESCEADAACLYAFYRFWSGDCYLMGVHSASHRIKTWVGDWRRGPQGGITFQKYLDPPPPSPPLPISPPAPPPSWPPHQLLVDPGEGVWPVEWFGNFSTVPYNEVPAAEWHGAEGIEAGYDFGLPVNTTPAARGLITLQRGFGANGELPNPPTIAATLPSLSMRANAVFSMWLPWNQLEGAQGSYDFTALEANMNATIAAGWLVGLRILTARLTDAPDYLSGRGIATLDHGENYDPANNFFHARYLALLGELKARGYCQSEHVAMVYAGYASHDPGDEYIGPRAYPA